MLQSSYGTLGLLTNFYDFFVLRETRAVICGVIMLDSGRFFFSSVRKSE